MKGLLFLHNGFEDCEALATRSFLKKKGLEIVTFTFFPSLEVFSSQKLQVKADVHINQIKLDDYDFLVLPGGPYVKQMLEKKDDTLKQILNIIDHFAKKQQTIGAICAAPLFLEQLHLLKHRPFTCYPGCEQYIDGIHQPNQTAVTSDNLITSRSPETVLDFVSHLVNKLQK